MPKIEKQSPTRAPRSKNGSVLDRIQDSVQFDREDGIKINLYGRSGTGKTTVWSSFPKKILAIVCSGSAKPGELRSIEPKYRKDIKPVVIEKSSEIRELIEHVKESEDYQTVVLDHASGLQDLVLKEILGLSELPVQSSWGMAKQQDWGQCALQMKELLRALLSLSCNVVIVAQEREFNNDGDSSDLLMPFVGSALTPSVTGWLNPACDYICQTFLRPRVERKSVKIGEKTQEIVQKGKGVDYCLRTGPDAVFTTKFRLPKGTPLPEVIVDPDYGKIEKLIRGA